MRSWTYRRRGDFHKRYMICASLGIVTAVVLLSQVGRFLVAGTPQWMELARWLVG